MIYNSVGAIPLNAEFDMNHQLTALSLEWAPDIQHIKELYAFRLLLRQKVAEFKKCIGTESEPDKFRDIFFTVTDVSSKLLASQNKLDVRTHGVDMYLAFVRISIAGTRLSLERSR